jgi:hypothetical protein
VTITRYARSGLGASPVLQALRLPVGVSRTMGASLRWYFKMRIRGNTPMRSTLIR